MQATGVPPPLPPQAPRPWGSQPVEAAGAPWEAPPAGTLGLQAPRPLHTARRAWRLSTGSHGARQTARGGRAAPPHPRGLRTQQTRRRQLLPRQSPASRCLCGSTQRSRTGWRGTFSASVSKGTHLREGEGWLKAQDRAKGGDTREGALGNSSTPGASGAWSWGGGETESMMSQPQQGGSAGRKSHILKCTDSRTPRENPGTQTLRTCSQLRDSIL